MRLPSKLILPCGNTALLHDIEQVYYCNYCDHIIGSIDEPSECKRKREEAEPIKNDYWMNINDEPEQH